MRSITQGFIAGSSLIRDNKEIISEYVNRNTDKSIKTRWVARMSADYAEALRRVVQPSSLMDPLTCNVVLGSVLRFDQKKLPHLAKLVSSERRDLINGDIPYFWTKPSGRDLFDSEGRIFENFFGSSGLDEFSRRLAYTEEKMKLQVLAIELSFGQARLSHSPFKAENIQGQATAIADVIIENVYLKDGLPFWLGARHSSNSGQISMMAGSLDLYSGAAGIGVFLAYCYQRVRDDKYKVLALQIHKLIRRTAREKADLMDKCGAYDGLSGLIYADLHLCQVFGGAPLCKSKRVLKKLVSLIRKDSILDIISGAAGALVGLCRCAEVVQTQAIRDTAHEAVSHLLTYISNKARNVEVEKRGCFAVGSRGVAHGSFGVAWALHEWLQVMGDGGIPEDVRRQLSTAISNDILRSIQATPYWNDTELSWCRGGVGFAAIVSNSNCGVGDDLTRKLLDYVRSRIKEAREFRSDDLGHGKFGLVDLLISIGDFYLAAQVIEKGAARQIIDGASSGAGLQEYGLMSGIAGVGMSMLRILDSKNVPSVLFLEGIGFDGIGRIGAR